MGKKRPGWGSHVVQSRGWFWIFVVLFLLCILIYVLNSFLSETRPYTRWGVGYGIAATIFMLGAALWALRRRTLSISPARSQHWVQFHVYGGTLFLILVLMHIGFRLPSGALAWWLFLTSVWVAVSGVLGVGLQKTIPRILTSGLSIEVHLDRIPELIQDIRQKSEEIVQGLPNAVQEFYRNELAPALTGPRPRAIYFMDITGGIQSRLKQFEYVRRFLSPEEKEKFNQLQSMYKAKLEMDAHYTLQKALRAWLYLHVPVSVILLFLVGIHVYAVLYY